MMKLILSLLLTIAATLFATSCDKDTTSTNIDTVIPPTDTETETESTMEINITISGKIFTANIDNTETGHAFLSLLPLTLDMNELNGNEKYCYLTESLPTDAKHFSDIAAGDLMLYGNSCIVLFYDRAGGYSYTPLGRLKTTDGLSSALGGANATVTFETAKQ